MADEGQAGAAGAGEADAAAAGQGQGTEAAAGESGQHRNKDGQFAAKPWSEVVAGITDEKVREFAGQHTGLEEFAKRALGLRQAASQREGWVKLPAKDASDEDRAAYRKAMGIPDRPEDYGIVAPAGKEAMLGTPEEVGAFARLAHGLGLTREQVQSLTQFDLSRKENYDTAVKAEADAALGKIEAELRQEWGADYDANLTHADGLVREFGGDELIEAFKGLGLNRHPLVMRFLGKVGRALAPDYPSIGQTTAGIQSSFDDVNREYGERLAKGENPLRDPQFKAKYDAAYTARFGKAA